MDALILAVAWVGTIGSALAIIWVSMDGSEQDIYLGRSR